VVLRHLKFYPTHEVFMRAFPDNSPKLVLAVPLSMSYGPSRRLFTKMATEESATIVLTGRSEDQTLSNEIFRMWNGLQAPPDQYGAGGVGSPKPASGTISVTIDSKVALEGEELEAHLEAERVAKEKELAHKAAQERSRRMLEADDLEDSDSDDEDDDEAEVDAADMALDKIGTDAMERQEGKGGQISTTGIPGAGNAFMETDDFRTASFDIFVKGQQMRTTSFFGGGRAGPSAGQTRFRMFPFVERKMRKVDVYGETLDVGAWIRKGREIEEEVESPEVREAKRRKKEEEEKQVSSRFRSFAGVWS
jgi:cleavage and polyadenylation specificity factor subunit 2